MGEIVRFRPRSEASASVRRERTESTDDRGGAEILLFLGVRYERHPEPLDTTLTPRRRRPSRRRA